MKAVIFIHILYLILIQTFMVKGVLKCESKVELRAVLLSCPAKESGCDDDDPLSQAMKSEESQILQADSKNFETLREEKERGFPNAVKDCKRKLVITLKIKNSGKIPCDDEYIVVDHVFDPMTGGRGRLLSPVVLKLRQEQMIQLYGLQFQRVVNSNPYEEQKAGDKTCSINPENPTCGIAMYDGKPIPFSEGFCCSFDPHVNAKRQLSPEFLGDSFLNRDSKLISQGSTRFPHEEKLGLIVNPELVKFRSGNPAEISREHKEAGSSGINDQLSWGKIPNFLLEHDRKIVCDRGDFMNELCKLREQRNEAESISRGGFKSRSAPGDASNNSGGPSGTDELKVGLDKAKLTTVAIDVDVSNANLLNDDHVNNVVLLKNFIKALNADQATTSEAFSEFYGSVKGSRGKRENRKENKKLTLEEKLDRFVNLKKNLANRRKRLLELSHKRFRKADEACDNNGQECRTVVMNGYMQDDYVRSPPPKYFFSHDRFIIDPLESPEMVMNTTCRSTEELRYEDLGKDKLYEASEKKVDNKMKGKEKFASGNLVSKKERVLPIDEGRTDNGLRKSKTNGQYFAESLKGTTYLKGDKRFNLFKEPEEKLEEDQEKENKENNQLFVDEHRREKTRFNSKNFKSFFQKSDSEKKLSKPRIRNFFMAKNRERQKLRSELVKGHKKAELNFREKENLENKKFKKLYNEELSNVENHQPEEVNKIKEGLIEKGNMAEKENLGEKEEKEIEEEKESSEEKENVEEKENIEEKENVEEKENMEEKESVEEKESEEEKENLGNQHESQERLKNPESLETRTEKFEVDPHQFQLNTEISKGKENTDEEGKFMQEPLEKKTINNRIQPSKEQIGELDFNVEIIRDRHPEISQRRHHFSPAEQFVKNRVEAPATTFETKIYDIVGNPKYLKNMQNPLLHYKSPQRYYIVENENISPQDVYLLQSDNGHISELNTRPRYLKETEATSFNSANLNNRMQPNYITYFYKKPSRHHYFPNKYAENEANMAKTRQIFLPKIDDKLHETQLRGKRYSELLRKYEEGYKKIPYRPETFENSLHSHRQRIRNKRSASYIFQPAKGFFRSEFDFQNPVDPIIHELETCLAEQKLRKSERADGWASKLGGWQFSRMKRENLSVDANVISSLQQLRSGFDNPILTARREKKSNLASYKQRLIQSYLNAPNYVLEEVEAAVKGKRQANNQGKKGKGPTSEKDIYAGEYTQDTAHCMRFGDLWYSLYLIKKPMISQTMGIQLFDKRSMCDGSSQWRDLTKGKMIRIGTFLTKAEDELPTISVTFMGGRAKKIQSAIDPDNYYLLIPSHVADPAKLTSYPQFEGGPEEYLLVQSKDVSSGGECNMIGTSFEAFARQPDRCAQRKGSCLKRQPIDLWREDMEARIRGKRGKYFVENFGTVSNSSVKTYTNLTGEFLALDYYGEYTSMIEIEVKADSNAIVRKGSNAQIPLVYIDGTYPKKTRIILSVLNIGLTSSYFRPRLGDCPPDLDPAWCPLEGPLVTIPPQQRHDFKLDLSGALPRGNIYVSVQVLNQVNKKIAFRKVVIKKGDRCVCAFHCKCNCIGNIVDGRTCHKLGLEEYRKAGYIGSYPFRGGAAASASESILGNIHIIFLTATYVLLFLGVIKGVLGIFIRRIGIAGIRVITGPRELCGYYEIELQGCSVLYDECGFPVHPTTCQPVQIVSLWLEVIINFLFFFLYPLRGIWFLLLSLPCCRAICSDCDGCCRNDEGDSDQKCSRPLLSKDPNPTCVHYNLTTVNSRKSKEGEFLPYPAYKGDDDPLEEDDTEFVLQEMKRYRKK